MVRCGNHGKAPGGVICKHLFRGTAKDWVRVADILPGLGPENEHDHVCRACAERLNELTAADMRLVCMHCMRRLRRAS
jgi:hypothetical protein